MIGSVSSSPATQFPRPVSTNPTRDDGREGFGPRTGGRADDERGPATIIGGKSALAPADEAAAVKIIGGRATLAPADEAGAATIIGDKTALAPADKTRPGETKEEEEAKTPAEGQKGAPGPDQLTEEEKAQVAKLKARDREVRAHEQAHAAAGGAIAGAPSYTYQTGPDGRQYAVGGEVPIRASASASNPRAAIAQLQQVVRAALAPAQPSGQDRAVAAQAQAQVAQLQAQLAQESQAKAQEALKSAAGGDEDTETAATDSATESAGSPKPPAPPEPPTPPPAAPTAGRQPNSAPPGLERSGAEPRGIGASEANPLARGGVSAHVQDIAAYAGQRDDEATAGGPIEIPDRKSGPFAAYQQADRDRNPPPAGLSGRIINLNA